MVRTWHHWRVLRPKRQARQQFHFLEFLLHLIHSSPTAFHFPLGMQVLFLPILGAIADYSHLRKRMMQIFATIGAIATILMFLITGGLWWLGGVLFIVANLAFGAAMVFYNAYLPDIASEDERDRVSSYGWAMGYLGGGILLALNLAFLHF